MPGPWGKPLGRGLALNGASEKVLIAVSSFVASLLYRIDADGRSTSRLVPAFRFSLGHLYVPGYSQTLLSKMGDYET